MARQASATWATFLISANHHPPCLNPGRGCPTPIHSAHSASAWDRSSPTPTRLAQERLLIGLVAAMLAYVSWGRNLRRERSTPETLVLFGTFTLHGALAKTNGS